MALDPAFVMVPCTTNLRGKYRVHIQDPGEPTGADFYPEVRVHAIGYRDTDVKVAASDAPTKPGTWYLLSFKELGWTKNPVWVHESDGHLDLGY
jgi:hypothetical protein